MYIFLVYKQYEYIYKKIRGYSRELDLLLYDIKKSIENNI